MNFKAFGEAIKSATGVSLAALIVILATNGKNALEALTALPVLIAAIASGLPLGAWSGLIATTAAALFHTFARSWHKRSLGIEVATVLIGITAVMLQKIGAPVPELLNAFLIGFIAGFGGLYASKLLRAMFKRDTNVKPDQTISKPD